MSEAKVKTGFLIIMYATKVKGNFLCGMNLAGFNEAPGSSRFSVIGKAARTSLLSTTHVSLA
jgi:hypothetical protein